MHLPTHVFRFARIHGGNASNDRAKEMMHTDRLANIGMMFSGLAHELKNPLTFISGNVQTLERFCQVLTAPEGGDKSKIEFVRADHAVSAAYNSQILLPTGDTSH